MRIIAIIVTLVCCYKMFAREKSSSTRYGGHDANAGGDTRFSADQSELHTTGGFPAVRVEKTATTFQIIATYTVSPEISPVS